MLFNRRMTTGVIALIVTIMTATPALAAGDQSDGDVQNIISGKTGARAAKASAKETTGQLSVSVGRDKTGKTLDSYSQRAGGGVRMMAVIEDESQGAVDFTLDLPAGAEVAKEANGSLVVSRPRGAGIVEVLGAIDAPWATDANGKNLATSYTYKAGVLTQQVDTKDAAFPIVADPRVKPMCNDQGCGVFINLKGVELKVLAASLTFLAHIAVAVGCAAAGVGFSRAVGIVVGAIVSAICFLVGSPSLRSTIQATLAAFNSVNVGLRWCYQAKIFPNKTRFRPTRVTDCA